MPDAARWAEIARRWRAGEPIDHLLDEGQRAAEEAFRASLADEGPDGVALLRVYDAKVRDVESGAYGARVAWHSSSPAQRRVLLFLAEGRALVRSVRVAGYYDAVPLASGIRVECPSGTCAVAKAARLDAARDLAARGLLDWDGGATDPEAGAVLSDRGRFVVAHREKGIGDAP